MIEHVTLMSDGLYLVTARRPDQDMAIVPSQRRHRLARLLEDDRGAMRIMHALSSSRDCDDEQAAELALADIDCFVPRIMLVRLPPTRCACPPAPASRVSSLPLDDFEAESPRYSLDVRLEIDPAAATSANDRFTLRSSARAGSATYSQTKTVRDDKIAGDDCVDLRFTDIVPGLTYWLEVDPGPPDSPHFIIQAMPWSEFEQVARRQ
ncbi:hypothetical protein ACNOYE_39565 [Nannocystaceae bacterium ST9]